ncbi:hypothetical protein GYMLUDRAFT_957196 [Collybiopsis luxurians FD-317 M1]|nr:hypothetical protein GYMLUDRAFT_957196 [Collybiopsis luxurians FD-317 M1]
MLCEDCGRFDDYSPRVSVPDDLPLYHGRPPPTLNRSVVDQILSDGEKDVEDYSAEIARLQAKALLLEQKRARLDEYLDRHRSSIAPIWSLPFDILSLVFEYVCSSRVNLNQVDLPLLRALGERRTNTLPQLRLGAVCSLWRSVLRSSPGCWSSFSVEFSKDSTPHPDLLQLFLNLSNQRLLSLGININLYNAPNVLELSSYRALMGQAHRWESLIIAGAHLEELDILRQVTIQSCSELKYLYLAGFLGCDDDDLALNFVPMPQLQSLGFLLNGPHGPDSCIPWNQLKTLSLHAICDVPKCLAQCEELLRLELFIREGDFEYPTDLKRRVRSNK